MNRDRSQHRRLARNGRTEEKGLIDVQEYLEPTVYINSDHPAVVDYAASVVGGDADPIGKAVRLFYAVRDGIKYDPYGIELTSDYMKASSTLNRQSGYCVTKAILLAALLRAQKIPSRLGFADVRNHLTSEKLKRLMKTDVFVYHGYTEVFLGERWLKVTPTFNKDLCEKFKVLPLEFDGRDHCMLQAFNTEGDLHMEYIKYRGHHADLPLESILAVSKEAYPDFFPDNPDRKIKGDFEKEAEQEFAGRKIA